MKAIQCLVSFSLLRAFGLFVCLLPLAASAQFNPQEDKVTAKFFPEAELDIHTPAFQKKDGFTDYVGLVAFLNAEVAAHPDLTNLTYIGSSQKGKQIPFITLTRKNGKPKTKVWLQGGLHGDEPAGTEALLYLTDRLLNDSAYTYLLNDLEIGLVPMANIDGYEKLTRESADGTDLNRDQTRLKAPESIALKRAFSRFGAAVSLDFHEYRPYRKDFTSYGARGITGYYDAMFLYSGNLNVPESLRNYTEASFVEKAKASLTENGLTCYNYFTPVKGGGKILFNLGSVHSRSSASSYALSNSVSTLIEIRGVGIGRTSFKRRIKTGFLVAMSYLKTAAQEQKKLQALIKETGSERFNVTALSDRPKEKTTIKVIDLDENKLTDLEVTMLNALHSKPVVQRPEPYAYLLLPSEKKAAFNLALLGLHLDSLSRDTELEAEGYTLTQAADESTGDDDAEGRKAGAGTLNVKQMFPKGTYIVYLNQKNARLACEVLEPENENGFVTNKVIKAQPGAMLPVYRYLKPEKIALN